MKISTKGRYTLRMILDPAEHQNCRFIALKNIAEQNISKKYPVQIIPIFNRSVILKTVCGSQGGCQLSKTRDKYTVGDTLRLTEGLLSPISYVEEPAERKHSDDRAILPV